MKKILIAVAAAVVGTAVQAASFNWFGSEVNNADYEYAEGATVYLFAAGYSLSGGSLATDTAVTYSDVSGAVTGGTFVKNDWASKAVSTAAVDDSGAFSTTTANLGDAIAKGDTVTLFAVILDDTAASTYAIVAGTSDVKVNATTGVAQWDLGDLESTTYLEGGNLWSLQGGGSGVPEPTSGLLLLMGFAGLALRRRRA